jgi:NAD(P)-dependent dehydrogenase (short-subunit alcohol dehydrogenase family)
VDVNGVSAVVTGGASGLGLASARRLADGGARVVIVDLETSDGEVAAKELGATFVAADVRSAEQVATAVTAAAELAPLRVLVHCAGRGGPVRVVEKDGSPGSLDTYTEIVTTNLIGTFNVLRTAAAAMAKTDSVNGERGVCVLTASVAAYEGQIGQIPYAASKAGVVGMTIVAARDLATKLIRVVTIAPGLFDTPLLRRVPSAAREALGASVPHPKRLGEADEYAKLAMAVVDNPMLNGETIRLDGAIRMAAR